MAILHVINTNHPLAQDALVALQEWGPVTMRLFLKLTMSYERERNYDDARVRYKCCITFAEAIIQAFSGVGRPGQRPNFDSVHTLEFLGILFEPLFAYAWLLEKNAYTSNNSISVLQNGIDSFDRILRFDGAAKNGCVNLIRSQWHKKASALCFFKGLTITNTTKVKESTRFITTLLLNTNSQTKTITCLEEARHYCLLSASNLSRYYKHYVGTAFNISHIKNQETPSLNTYTSEQYFSIAKCLSDLSDILLAGIDPVELYINPGWYSGNKSKDCDHVIDELINTLDEWFLTNHSTQTDLLCWLSSECYENKLANQWLNQFDLAINLSFASALYLERAGHNESAARETMHTLETIAQYISWYWFNNVFSKISKFPGPSSIRVLYNIIKKIKWHNNNLLRLFQSIRFIPNPNTSQVKYLIGDVIPCSALTPICSIGLSLSLLIQYIENPYRCIRNRFSEALIDTYVFTQNLTGNEHEMFHGPIYHSIEYDHYYYYFLDKIIYSIKRHRYPVLNQLNALKSLIDASMVKGYLTGYPKDVRNTRAWIYELYQINEKYNHPHHFTPMEMGHSLFLYWLVKKNCKNLDLPEEDDPILDSETLRLLTKSVDMCHSGRSYYEVIDKMYYLYDDFNNSQMHRNQAWQIAGVRLTKDALELLKKQP